MTSRGTEPSVELRTAGPTGVAVAVLTVGVLPVFLTGALAVQIGRDLHFDAAALGVAVSAFFTTAALFSAAAGRLSERVGATGLMRWAPLLAAAAMFTVAAAAERWGELVALMGVAGVANGLAQPAINQFLAERVPATRQGLAFGIKQAAVPLSTLLGGVSVPLIGLTVGWRWAFVGGGVLALIVVALVPAGPARPTALAAAPPPRAPLPYAPLLLLAAAVTFGTGAANALGAFLVTSAVHSGMSKGAAGLLAAFGSAVAVLARMGVGVAGDRIRRRHLLLVATMLAVGGAGYALLAVGATALLLPAAAVAFGAGWGWNGLFTFAVVRANPGAPARATGVTQTGIYLGGMLGPLAFGLIARHASYEAAWAVMAIAAGVASAGVATGYRLFRGGGAGSLPAAADP